MNFFLPVLGDELLSSRPCHGLDDSHSLSPQVAWVLCDDCQKWRCISAELADAINETKCRWLDFFIKYFLLFTIGCILFSFHSPLYG